MTWLPQTKSTLVNEIYYLYKGVYKKYEIERVYFMELNRIPERNKYYARESSIKKLQAWLIQLRTDIRRYDGDVSKLKYNITIKDEKRNTSND